MDCSSRRVDPPPRPSGGPHRGGRTGTWLSSGWPSKRRPAADCRAGSRWDRGSRAGPRWARVPAVGRGARCVAGPFAHPDEGAAAQLHAVVVHQPTGVRALFRAGGDHVRKEERDVSRSCWSGDAILGEPSCLPSVNRPAPTARFNPVRRWIMGTSRGSGCMVRSVGTVDGEHDADSDAPAALVFRGRPEDLGKVEEGERLFTDGVSNRDDWEQSCSPRGSLRSWPRRCPRPRRRAHTRPAVPGGPVRPAR